MPTWLFPLLSILVGLVGGWVGAHIGARVALARLETDLGWVKAEVVKLREAKHEHASILQRHEMDIEMLKRAKSAKVER